MKSSTSHTASEMERKQHKRFPQQCEVNLCRLSSASYLIEKGVCYLVLCEGSFPKKLAFAYLEDLQAEFHEQHGKRVPTVSRPYSFIEFGMMMSL